MVGEQSSSSLPSATQNAQPEQRNDGKSRRSHSCGVEQNISSADTFRLAAAANVIPRGHTSVYRSSLLSAKVDPKGNLNPFVLTVTGRLF
ncbi:hypothetical protein CEXT_763621 [Caerostris extrusa]|uniref:Uncharacterized protein n=1 Tax=Caerostris extrusa TaxID=172846 RepID=A0AAV4UB90_CAEEX|nr:hypothetical protein CEXT_763621 [Caerostris extrusa]